MRFTWVLKARRVGLQELQLFNFTHFRSLFRFRHHTTNTPNFLSISPWHGKHITQSGQIISPKKKETFFLFFLLPSSCSLECWDAEGERSKTWRKIVGFRLEAGSVHIWVTQMDTNSTELAYNNIFLPSTFASYNTWKNENMVGLCPKIFFNGFSFYWTRKMCFCYFFLCVLFVVVCTASRNIIVEPFRGKQQARERKEMWKKINSRLQ